MIANFKKPSHLQPWLKLQFHFPIWREWASKACDIFRQRNPKWNPLLEVSTALVGCAGIFPTAPDLHNTGSELIRFKSNPEIVNLSQMKSHVLELWAILVFSNTQKRKHKKKNYSCKKKISKMVDFPWYCGKWAKISAFPSHSDIRLGSEIIPWKWLKDIKEQ